MKTAGTNHNGMLLIISGPSGVGKTTITHRVREELGGVSSVSVTTRPAAEGDVEGRDYFFVDQKRFEGMRDGGELLEWAKVFGKFYGTPRAAVERALGEGKLIILEIDVEGAIQIKRMMAGAFAVFVLPPSEAVLLERLRHRKRDAESVIQERFANAKHEIERAKESGVYDAFVVNEKLEEALGAVVGLVNRAREKRKCGAGA